MKLRYSPWGLCPPDPLRGWGGVIAFKWPDRPPPEKILATPLKSYSLFDFFPKNKIHRYSMVFGSSCYALEATLSIKL
ncbi:MAG: hypothetical protein FD188_3401 [Ignavibacteria bacterium]|nr:MAG: hypothetical protein FD188_3401 [Ignavibacteria bacterium]